MECLRPISAGAATSLATALILSSRAPLLLLDAGLNVTAASDTFCQIFEIDSPGPAGVRLADLGSGEWNGPQLHSLLRSTASGDAAIDAYEMDLVREGKEPCRVVVNAHKLDYFDADQVRIVMAVTDLTAARLAEKIRNDLVRDKEVLMQELQHRVANSLQIIAAVLMRSARTVQCEETRLHLHDAHHRVMSIATLQKQLAISQEGDVELRSYFSDLCQSIDTSMIADHEHLSLKSTVDDSKVGAAVSISLGLIVTELVINSLKHAFPVEGRVGEIIVDFASDGTAWALTVGDNGMGMPGDHARATPGLGTGIVEALSKQLDASVTVIDANPGTKVLVVHN